MAGPVHYELFIRRVASDDWSLRAALPDRAEALIEADALVASGRAASAKVCKEMLDEGSGLFSSVTIHSCGLADAASARRRAPATVPAGPPCGAPQDLYTPRARETLGRLLDDWLRRRGATVFELLHSPALAEELDAHGEELKGAVQRFAIPVAQASGKPLHEVIRRHQSLAARAIARLAADGRRRAFPDVDPSTFAVAAGRLAGRPEAAYLLGGGVAAHFGEGRSWRARLVRIAALAEAAPEVGPGRALALTVLEAPLDEILGGRAGLVEIAGATDLGGALAWAARMAAGAAAAAVALAQPGLLRPLPSLDAEDVRLQALLSMDAFARVRATLLRRVLAEIGGPRRLRPADAQGEIELLRALAALLGAAAGPRLPLEDVRASFLERSRRLVAPDFAAAVTEGVADPVEAARALVRLAENVTGAANKRAAARWIDALLGSLRFDTAMRHVDGAPGARLAALAALQRALADAELDGADVSRLQARVGEAGGRVEAEARLVAAIGRSPASALARAAALLKLAAGQAAPLGPAADRARAEAVRLMRTPELKADAAADPEALARLRRLLAA